MYTLLYIGVYGFTDIITKGTFTDILRIFYGYYENKPI